MSTQPQQEQTQSLARTSPLILELANEWKMTAATMINTLKATVFPQKDKAGNQIIVSDGQLMAFLQVAHTYKLNPFLRELYAFPTKGGGIVPMVPIDGWSNLINRNPAMDGIDFVDEWELDANGARKSVIPFSTTCIIYRKDRSHPIKVTEYFHECRQDKDTWAKWPARMLRWKAMIQCARVAFSLTGIFDPDEAERIADVGDNDKPAITRPTRASAVIDAQPIAQAAVSETKTEEPSGDTPKGSSTAQHQPGSGSSACFCSCCKAGKCNCRERDDFEKCGCAACKLSVAAPEVRQESPRPTSAAVEQPTPQATSVASNQPSGDELFGPQPGQSKPAGPYATTKQVTKLIIAAKASGVDIKKDSHEDVIHKMLKANYGIESLTEIPVAQFDEILKMASNAGPVKVNAK